MYGYRLRRDQLYAENETLKNSSATVKMNAVPRLDRVQIAAKTLVSDTKQKEMALQDTIQSTIQKKHKYFKDEDASVTGTCLADKFFFGMCSTSIINICVGIYILLYICVCACMYVCTYVRMCTCSFAFKYIYVYICVCMYII